MRPRVIGVFSALSSTVIGEEPDATIRGRTDDCTLARSRITPRDLAEKSRHQSDAFRQNRQDGFSDSAVRSFLFLHRLCRCLQSPQGQYTGILPLRSYGVGRCIALLHWFSAFSNQPDLFW